MFIGLDIETTGLTARDEVTVIGTVDDGMYRVYYNSEKGEIDDYSWDYDDKGIQLIPCDGEIELLESLESLYRFHNLKVEVNMLVGFSSGDYDIPFLRTRCLMNGIDWHLSGANHVDIKNVTKWDWHTKEASVEGLNKKPLKKFAEFVGTDIDGGEYKHELLEKVQDNGFNTHELAAFTRNEDRDMPTKTTGTLDGLYDLLVGDGVPEPIDGDSKKAAEFWEDGGIKDIVGHNISDLAKTKGLFDAMIPYIRQDDLTVKKV